MELSKASIKALCTDVVNRQEELQNKMAGEGWKNKSLPFYRAIWREAAECFDHIPWEWWKKQNALEFTDTRKQQTMLELTDILLFGVADWLCQYRNMGNEAIGDLMSIGIAQFIDGKADTDEIEELRSSLEELMANAIGNQRFSMNDLCIAYNCLGYTPAHVFLYYYGKNALNHLRQEHGDKIGMYNRTWADGRADNEHLAELIETMVTGLNEEELMRWVTDGNLIPILNANLNRTRQDMERKHIL